MGGRKAFGAAILASLLVAAPAGAATITVNTTADVLTEGGLCSLRQAIETVNGAGDGACGTASSGANTIVLGATTYTLTRVSFLIIGKPPEGCISFSKEGPDDNSSGELSVAENVKELTIEGVGAGQTILDACKLGDRALQVKPGAGVTLKGLTITNGNAPGGAAGTAGATNGSHGGAAEPGANGGGILNEANLTLTDTAITNNHAGFGGAGGKGGPLGGSGGIGAGGGSGGAIASTGTLTVSESTISGNSAGDGGGGGEATASGTGQGGSGASGGNGGGGAGIANFGGTATVEKSTITANTAGAGGAGSSGKNSGEIGGGGNGGDGGSGGNGAGIAIAGALFKPTAVLQATDDTIQGNIAGDGANGGNPGERSSEIFTDGKAGDGGDGGFGGGVENLLNTATQLVNLTIAENSAGHAGLAGTALPSSPPPAGTNGEAGHGGGVYGLTSPTLQNTILYENGTGDDCRGSIVDGGHNLVFSKPSLKGLVSDPCKFSAVTTEDPKLAPLAANAGPTETMRPQAGSAAIDQVPASGAGCPATDQRGVPRPGGAACDIGAYEVVAPAIANVGASAISTSGATLSATVAADAPEATVQFQYGPTTAYGSSTTPQSAAGLSPAALLAQLSALASGTTFHFRVVATSQDGTSTSADQTFTTAAGTPVISKVSESNRRWRVGTRLASVARKAKRPPVGTTFSFTLNEAASVSFSFTQRVGGRKVKGKCVAQRKKNRHKHACKRTVTRGAVSLTAHAGLNKAIFQGRLSHKLKLKPGTYTLVITAKNSAGQRSAASRLTFTIVR
jgi:CSLREA domain-containing protein